MDADKNILITGSSGFIGRALCDHLSSCGTIISMDLAGEPSSDPGIVRIRADLNDRDAVRALCKKYSPGAVVHCAGIAHQKAGAISAAEYLRTNSGATEDLARAVAEADPDLHFIFLSTISVYGEALQNQPAAEDSLCRPSSDYAFSKLDAEKRLVRLYEEGLFRRLTILRLAPVYDREWRLNLERRVFAPKRLAYLRFGGAGQLMSALARPNLVEFIAHLLKRRPDHREIEIMNVCDPEPYSFREIIHAFKESGIYPVRPAVAIPLPIVWTSTRIAGLLLSGKRDWLHSCYDKLALDLVFDNSKMLQTGFNPVHSLETVFIRRN